MHLTEFGQSGRLHSLNSVEFPEHLWTPSRGGTLQARALISTPSPQVTEHLDHWPHSCHVVTFAVKEEIRSIRSNIVLWLYSSFQFMFRYGRQTDGQRKSKAGMITSAFGCKAVSIFSGISKTEPVACATCTGPDCRPQVTSCRTLRPIAPFQPYA